MYEEHPLANGAEKSKNPINLCEPITFLHLPTVTHNRGAVADAADELIRVLSGRQEAKRGS